jgi:protein-arginine deiminase
MVTFTVKVTRPASNKLLKAVSIDVAGTTNAQKTPSFGDDDTSLSQEFQLEPGDNYTITVTGPGYLRTQAQNVTVSDAGETTIALKSVWFSLHSDRDRDGKIENGDDTPGTINDLSPAAITFGVDGVGAIIPVNCNRDGNNTAIAYSDCQDDKINSDEDLLTGLSRMKIIRHSAGEAADVDANWVIKLSVEPTGAENPAEQHVRIFSKAGTDATELVSPQKGKTATLDAANINPNLVLPLEMIRFAGEDFESGTVKITLSVIQPEYAGPDTPSYTFTEQVVAARWIANHHLHQVTKLLVVSDDDNVDFIEELKTAVANEPKLPSDKSYQIMESDQKQVLIPYLDTNKWALEEPSDDARTATDQWMRDTIFSGYSSWPGTAGDVKTQTTFIKMHRERYLQNWVFRDLLSKDFAVYYPAAGSGDAVNSANSGGNFEVTPPIKKSGGKTYPLGRIYYGHSAKDRLGANSTLRKSRHKIDESTRSFIMAQKLQSPIELDTDWLAVGHVDEMMTFLPNPGGGNNKKWKLLVASPKKAYDLMTDKRAENVIFGGAKVLQRPKWDTDHFNYTALKLHKTVVSCSINDLLGNGNAPLPAPNGYAYTYDLLKGWNVGGVEKAIGDNIDILKDEFDLEDDDIVRVPVIFYPSDHVSGGHAYVLPSTDKVDNTKSRRNGFNIFPGRGEGFKCGALTADMPNMFVGNTQLYIPKPYGPWIDTGDEGTSFDLFEKYLKDEIAKFNGALTCNFIDDWNDYHACEGEIHCGTNEIRKPSQTDEKWWAI